MNKRNNKSWSYKEDMELIKLHNEGKSHSFIAQYFGRSYSSISARISRFRQYGYVEEMITSNGSFSRESMAEMKDAVDRFDKIAAIPLEWKTDWAERNNKNLLQVGDELSRMYEKKNKR